jgi:hypothetical protein
MLVWVSRWNGRGKRIDGENILCHFFFDHFPHQVRKKCADELLTSAVPSRLLTGVGSPSFIEGTP